MSIRQNDENIAIVGIGRLGYSLAIALSETGWMVSALSDRIYQKADSTRKLCGEHTRVFPLDQLPADITCVFLTVPDDAIAEVVDQLVISDHLSRETVVVHTSGALSSRVLHPLSKQTPLLAAVHPVQTFSGAAEDWKRLMNIYFGVEGDAAALERLNPVISSLQGTAVLISADQKAFYHLSCVVASNFAVALQTLAIHILTHIGVKEQQAIQLLHPLATASIDNVQKKGPVKALTGPITRGDVGTVTRQLEALRNQFPEYLSLYKSFGKMLVDLARQQQSSPDSTLDRIEDLFHDD
jgi:predicted short-subunit dehydrogenase-like oxidoreductase (DUF2520 family)